MPRKRQIAGETPKPKPRPERVLRDEAAAILGVPGRTVTHLAVSGQIPGAAKIGRLWTFDEVRLRAWVREKEDEIVARADRPRPYVVPPIGPHRRATMPWEKNDAYDRVMGRLLRGDPKPADKKR